MASAQWTPERRDRLVHVRTESVQPLREPVTRSEALILSLLIKRRNTVVAYSTLLMELRHYGFAATQNSDYSPYGAVWGRVYTLRRLLHPRWRIVTHWGHGYEIIRVDVDFTDQEDVERWPLTK